MSIDDVKIRGEEEAEQFLIFFGQSRSLNQFV